MCAKSRPKPPARRVRVAAPPPLDLVSPFEETDAERAQELFYAAMEARTKAQTLKLLRQAHALDSRHADVNLMLLDLDPKSAPDRVARLREIVADATAALGPDAFEEYAGHFWGFIETRPYMRARAALAEELRTTGRAEEAAAEYLALLVLNPNDNQGLRYELLPLLLALGRTSEATKLLSAYPKETAFAVVPAWGALLLHLIDGNEKKAAKSLQLARKANPHVEPYLTGAKPVPADSDLPDAYSPGAASEADCYASALHSAWSKHPAAQAWLRARA
jgi:tetratricopeptide (TPR) repeat protein